MENNEEKRIRIGNMQGALMLGVALTIDGVQFLLNFIPFIGWIFVSLISIFVWLTFYLWFKLNGVGFIDGSVRFVIKTTILFVSAVIEVIPIINDLPTWIFSVALMLFIVRSEDVIFNKTGKNIQIQKALKRIT